MARVYLAVRASRERIVELLQTHGVEGRVMRPTDEGWAAASVSDEVAEGVLAPLLAAELGAVLTVHETPSGPEVVLRDAHGTVRFRPQGRVPDTLAPGDGTTSRDAAPQNVFTMAARLHELSDRRAGTAEFTEVLTAATSGLSLIRGFMPLLGLPDGLSAQDRQVVAYRGPAGTVRVWAMSSSPVLLTPAPDGWQLAVPHPTEIGAGETLASVLAHGLTARGGGRDERVLLLGRDGPERSVSLAADMSLPEARPASWAWDPFRLEIPPPPPRPVAARLHWAFPGSDVERIERALTITDADHGLRALLAALDVPVEAADVLTMPERDLVARSEGVGRGTGREIRRELASPGVLPQPEPSRVTRGFDRVMGVVWSVLGTIIVLLALVMLALDVSSLAGEGLLPRSPGPLLLMGLALVFLGYRQHRRGVD